MEDTKGGEHESIFTLKMAFLACFQTVFYHKHSRALFCLQDKGDAQRTSDFTASTMTSVCQESVYRILDFADLLLRFCACRMVARSL